MAEAKSFYDRSVGFILATGVGPYMMNAEIATGAWALLSQNVAFMAAFEAAKAGIITNQTISVFTGVSILSVLYKEQLLFPDLKMATTQADWRGVAKLTRSALEMVFLPEAEAAEVQHIEIQLG